MSGNIAGNYFPRVRVLLTSHYKGMRVRPVESHTGPRQANMAHVLTLVPFVSDRNKSIENAVIMQRPRVGSILGHYRRTGRGRPSI